LILRSASDNAQLMRPAGPSPGFSSRGEGPNTRREPHFKNTVLDVCSNRGAKREMGEHRFQMGGPGTTSPPLATALATS